MLLRQFQLSSIPLRPPTSNQIKLKYLDTSIFAKIRKTARPLWPPGQPGQPIETAHCEWSEQPIETAQSDIKKKDGLSHMVTAHRDSPAVVGRLSR